MTIAKKSEYQAFIDTLTDELLEMSDEQVLNGLNTDEVHATGMRLLNAAKVNARRSRLAAAKNGYAVSRSRPFAPTTPVSTEEAHKFLAQASNDKRFTLAARNLGELTDDEALDLYNKLLALQSDQNDIKK